jgi:uncharacterized protein YjbI with pentapeptide repeats
MTSQANRVEAILERLSTGDSIERLGLGQREGRWDLRGVSAQPLQCAGARNVAGVGLTEIQDRPRFSGLQLESVDFTGATLQGIVFENCTFHDCLFDGADCRGWSVWDSDVSDTSFVDADLRGAALGPLKRMRQNRYERVSFARADFRDAVCSAGVFVEVDFGHAKLIDLDFRASRFERCRFAGDLREVVFWHRNPIVRTLRSNKMEEVDFSEAELRWTEFRGLDMDLVRWPESGNHVLVDSYPRVLSELLAALDGDDSVMGRVLRSLVDRQARWVGKNQRRGIVLHRLDLLEHLDAADVDRAIGLVRETEARYA